MLTWFFPNVGNSGLIREISFGPIALTVLGGLILVMLKFMNSINRWSDRSTTAWPSWVRKLIGIEKFQLFGRRPDTGDGRHDESD